MSVTPSSVLPGPDFVVTGGGCEGGGSIVGLRQDGVEFEGAQGARSGPDGTWTTSLTVPQLADPSASFTVRGACYADGNLVFVYPDVPFDVE